jgi:hypothetical protein
MINTECTIIFTVQKRKLSSLLLKILILLFMQGVFYMHTAYAQAPEKPSVAIKSPVAGEGVSKGSLKSLNLSQLLAEMEASLLATRKFEVVTRQKDKLGAIREEQEFAQSDFAKGNAAPEGQLKNANYLIIPVVQHFEFGRSTRPVPNISNKYFRRDSGLLEINAQVLDTASGAIKTTFYLKSSFGTSDEVVNSSGGGPGSGYFVTMAKKVAAQMADQLVDTVFPMRILNVQDNQVWINRGADGGLKVNDTLNVYKPGAELIDPDTGEKLGSAEKLIGKIKVVRVNPKFTIAEVQTKEMKDPIDKGYIIRKP